MRFVNKVRALFALFFGLVGWIIGGSIGIAAMGTAIAGGWVVAAILAGFAWLLSPIAMDKLAKRFAKRGEK